MEANFDGYTVETFTADRIARCHRSRRNRHESRFVLLSLVLGVGACRLPAIADTATKKIAFSNNYAGNSWRQAMLKSYGIVAKKAVADKIVAAADIFTTRRQGSAHPGGADPEPDPAGL